MSSNWTMPDSASVLRVNASRYDRLRVQTGTGPNAGKFRAIMSRVPSSAISSVPFSGWFGDRAGAEDYLVNLVGQLSPLWIRTEQNEYINFEQFDQIEVRQQSGGQNDGKWKAYATRIVGGAEEIEDISNWKAGRAGAEAVAQQVADALDAVQLRLSASIAAAGGG